MQGIRKEQPEAQSGRKHARPGNRAGHTAGTTEPSRLAYTPHPPGERQYM